MKKWIISLLIVSMAVAGIVWAADVKISDMIEMTSPDPGDIVPMVDVSGSTNRKITLGNAIRKGHNLGPDGIVGTSGISEFVLLPTISGASLDWTGGVTLPYLSDVTAALQNQINSFVASGGPESDALAKTWLNQHTAEDAFSGVTAFGLKDSITSSTNADAFTGTTEFATRTQLASNTLSLSGVSGEATRTTLADHTSDTAFSGSSAFALKSALSNSTDLAAFAGTTGFATKTELTGHTDLIAFTGTTGFATKDELTLHTTSISAVSGTATKTLLDDHTGAAAFAGSTGGVSNFALKSALSTSNVLAAFTGTTGFALKTTLTDSTNASTTSGTSILWSSGTTLPRLAGVTDYVQAQLNTAMGQVSSVQDDIFSSGWNTDTTHAPSQNALFDYLSVYMMTTPPFAAGTSGYILLSPGSGTTPSQGNTLPNVSLTTGQPWEKNRVLVFDENGIMSGATQIQYSGVTRELNISGVTLVILSGTSATMAPCAVGTLFWDYDEPMLYVCSEIGKWSPASPAGTGTVNNGTINRLAYYVATGTAVDDVGSITTDGTYLFTQGLTPNGRIQPYGTNDISGVSLAWTAANSGVTLPYLAGVTTYVQLRLNAINNQLNAFSGVSGEASKGQLATHTDAAAYVSSTGGVSNFALKAALTASVEAAAFTGTTAFATRAILAANTVTLSGVSGEATKASLATHTDAAAFAGSTSGVSNFALKDATSTALNSGATLETVATSTVAGKLFYDATGPQVGLYSATPSGNTEWVVSAVTDSISFVISGVTHGKDNLTPWGAKYTGQDDMILWKPPYNIVLKEVLGITDSGATVIWNLGNCDSAGANCVQMLTNNIASGSTGNMNATDYYSFANSDVTGYQTLRLNVIWSGVSANNNGWFGSGVTTNFTGTINFWKQRR